MAKGLEVYDALKQRVENLPSGSDVAVGRFDAYDLCKLSAEDLVSRGYGEASARRVSDALMQTGRLDALGESMGVKFIVLKATHSVVSQIRLRELAGTLADEPETMEQTLEELDRIRHPERYTQ